MASEESESGEMPEQEQTERPIPARSTVKAKLLKPKPLGTVTGGQEIEDAVSELAERIERLESKSQSNWREVGQKETKPVGTNFDSALIDRLNKTVEDYQKAGIKLYKRKLLESGLNESLDDLNSTWQLDDAFKKSRGDPEKFVGYLAETAEEAGETETEKTWVWTSERSRHALALFRGRPDEIEKLLTLEPQLRQFLDFQAIERAKRAAKVDIKGESEDISDGLFGLFDQGEGEGEEEGGEEEEPFP